MPLKRQMATPLRLHLTGLELGPASHDEQQYILSNFMRRSSVLAIDGCIVRRYLGRYVSQRIGSSAAPWPNNGRLPHVCSISWYGCGTLMTTTRGSRPTIPRLSPASLFSFQPIPDYGAAKQRARRPDEVSPWPGHLLALLGGRCVSYLQVATQVS